MAVYASDIIETAKSFLNKLTYSFGSDNITGGTGDCSSYTEYVYSVYGLNIGADTSAQYTNSIAIEDSERLPGDLVFFKDTYNSGKINGVSHVGISLGGDKFIHLGNSGCKINSLTEDYYKSHYLATHRVKEVTYDITADESKDIPGDSKKANTAGLKWWGDVVRVVVIILLIITAIVFTASSFGFKISDIVKEVKKANG